MKCPSCNKTASVVIGTKHYCTNCGERMVPEDKVAKKPTPPKAAVRSLDMSRPPAQTATAAPMPAPPRETAAVVTPVAPTRLMRDVAVGRPAKTEGPPTETKAAEAFHARLKPARGGVLDLRAATPKAVAAPAKHVAVPAPNIHTPAKAQAEIPKAVSPKTRQRQLHHQLEAAGQIHRSRSISRFGRDTGTAEPAKLPITPAPAQQPEPVLPNHAATQHEHLSRLLELSADSQQTPKKAGPKLTKANFATAAIAIVIIGGYIWVHNYPHLAISTAADKAGFSASLPSYVPSSYNLNGPVSYAPGLVTLNFTSPSFKDPLKVTQQPTSWDSKSLLDNYVAQKSTSYSTVEGQGLTLYLFNNDQQVAWVNHGIWYTVQGATHLGRDQLLKMAYSF